MTEITNPHDSFFKRLFSLPETGRDFLINALPSEIAEMLDFDSIERSKDTFIDDKLKKSFSDMIFKLRFKDNAKPVYIYALIEHKSYPEPMVGFQLLLYMVRIWEGVIKEHVEKQKEARDKRKQGIMVNPVEPLKKLPAIIPIVLYHGKSSWNIGLNFKSLIDTRPGLKSFIPDFDYLLYDLSNYEDDEIKGAVILQIGLLLFKYIFRNELPERLPGILSLLNNLADKRY